MLQEIKVSIDVEASLDQSVPVHALESDVSVVLLELEVDCLAEIYVRAFDCVHVFGVHSELIEIKVLWKDLHVNYN